MHAYHTVHRIMQKLLQNSGVGTIWFMPIVHHIELNAFFFKNENLQFQMVILLKRESAVKIHFSRENKYI